MHLELPAKLHRIDIFPLWRNTVLRASTLKWLSWARLLIRLSVIPSAQYSASGEFDEVKNGNTASDSIPVCLSRPARCRLPGISSDNSRKINARSRAD